MLPHRVIIAIIGELGIMVRGSGPVTFRALECKNSTLLAPSAPVAGSGSRAGTGSVPTIGPADPPADAVSFSQARCQRDASISAVEADRSIRVFDLAFEETAAGQGPTSTMTMGIVVVTRLAGSPGVVPMAMMS